MTLLDTNVLVYAVDAAAVFHSPCRRVVARAMSGELGAVVVPQVLVEFYAIVTSPRRVESPRSAGEALAQIADWRSTIPIRYPTARCVEEWLAIAGEAQRVGQDVHDLFLAAQMRAHSIAEICTVNASDFEGIAGITVRHPESI